MSLVKTKIRGILNKISTPNIFISALVIFAVFPFRKTFITDLSYTLGFYSDFTTYFIAIAGITALCLLIYSLFKRRSSKYSLTFPVHYSIILLVYTFFNFALNKGNLFYFGLFKAFMFILPIVLHGTLITTFLKEKTAKYTFSLIISLSIIQSILILIQFLIQDSLGLTFLMEPNLAPDLSGVARLAIQNSLLLRGYGTFLHPNIAGFFLSLGIMISIMFRAKHHVTSKIIFHVVITVQTIGLTLTFSRSAVSALMIALFINISYQYITNHQQLTKYIAPLLYIATSFLLVFSLNVFTWNSDPIQNRLSLNEYAIKLIRDNPLIGIGISNPLLHMQQLVNHPIQSWEIQPIHNTPLLLTAELGIIGLLLFIMVFIPYIKNLIELIKNPLYKEDFEINFWLTFFVFVLIVIQFDHYLLTSFQAQYLFWIFIALFAAYPTRLNNSKTYDNPSQLK